MAATDKLFRMILMSHEGTDPTVIDDAPKDWIVSAVLKSSRGGMKVSATMTAENINTHEVFTYPQDSDKIIDVLPAEFWPSFITDLVVNKTASFNQDVLV